MKTAVLVESSPKEGITGFHFSFVCEVKENGISCDRTLIHLKIKKKELKIQ